MNGDGYTDAIVGAYHYENGQPYEGRAYVYHGPYLGFTTLAASKTRLAYEWINPDELNAIVHVGEPAAHRVVPGATVEVTFELPEGMTSESAVTDGLGRAKFRVSTGGGGTCSVRIESITQEGYTWDAELGKVKERIECPEWRWLKMPMVETIGWDAEPVKTGSATCRDCQPVLNRLGVPARGFNPSALQLTGGRKVRSRWPSGSATTIWFGRPRIGPR